MSEYQYHEWQTVDRPLTDKERAEVNKLSSHIDVRSTGAWVEYSWGDFKHDPKQVLARYFDAYIGTQAAFEARLRQLTQQYARRPSLMAALKSAGRTSP